MADPETRRLADTEQALAWRRWGPYLSDRQWGTVREDYSADGDAWAYLPHDHARSRAYRWGEDGIGGFSDDRQLVCMSLALWNGHDPILKERLFGLTNSEGNHGEDVKELYYYLDGVPSHAWMRMLYKYPQAAFPYQDLLETNRTRGLDADEYEILDTGVFNENRYFDVEIAWAKADEDDVLCRITATNRGPDAARLHLLPQVWFRNVWSWHEVDDVPEMHAAGVTGAIELDHPRLPALRWACDGNGRLLFCGNDTNIERLYGTPAPGPFKDGINDCVVGGRAEAVSATGRGTKAAMEVVCDLAPGESKVVRVRLRPQVAKGAAFADFDRVMAAREQEADQFYAGVQAKLADAEAKAIQRQALAGMLWCKQFYGYDVWRWLEGDPGQPPPPAGRDQGRNARWRHVVLGDVETVDGGDILSMPDAWEYPWFAAWDLAFHAVTLALIDPGFAKHQLLLLTAARALHPSGQMAAYEWNFEDVNPPVHAWAAMRLYQMERDTTGQGDIEFLKRMFHKLLLNFTWWVNREDSEGNNIFEGGFLGLDNIGVFDLREPLPGGGRLDQSDGTAWAAVYALRMMRMAIELTLHDPAYEDLAAKFFEHFMYIAEAVHETGGMGHQGLWDEADQFYYDVLRQPGRAPVTLKVRSVVGLLPLFAVEVIDEEVFTKLPRLAARMDWFLAHRPDLAALVSDWRAPNAQGRRLISLLRTHRLGAVLARMLDGQEFLSDHGIRSVSKVHAAHPYVFEQDGIHLELHYEPGEGRTRIYGGNSNWRGPVWMPINFLLVETLRRFDRYFGTSYKLPCPRGTGQMRDLGEIADDVSLRLQSLFRSGADGQRPCFGGNPWALDPHFRDLLLFHEYFHGDSGKGLGAAHQTGWTGLVALLIAESEAQ
jgi:hypothetical protein